MPERTFCTSLRISALRIRATAAVASSEGVMAAPSILQPDFSRIAPVLNTATADASEGMVASMSAASAVLSPEQEASRRPESSAKATRTGEKSFFK